MNYRLLGKSGLRVSELCLGTMTFGEDWGWGSPRGEARKIYDAFRDAGGNFIDTANVYTNGMSETFLGEFMTGHRESLVLATKYTNAAPSGDPNASGNQRKSMVQSVEASLRRLKTDYIDLYWLHIWDQLTPVEEVMGAFDDLVQQGKVLYSGISDAPAWWIAQANTVASLRASNGRFASKEMQQFLPEQERATRIVAALDQISQQTGRSKAQVALAWLRNREVPVIPIIGARKVNQLEDNLKSLTLALDHDQVRLLDAASEIQLGFPHDLYRRDMVRGFVYGGLRDRIIG